MFNAILNIVMLVCWSIMLLISILAREDNELRFIAMFGSGVIVVQTIIEIIKAMVN